MCVSFLSYSQSPLELNHDSLEIKITMLCNCIENKIDTSKTVLTYKDSILIKEEYYCQNGKLDLVVNHISRDKTSYKYYFNNGQLNYFYSFKCGKLDSIWQRWDEKGNLLNLENYIDGILEGKVVEWYFDTLKSHEYSYTKGLIDGESKEWYENGILKSISFYSNGKLLDVFSLFDRKGRPINYGTIKNGNGLIYEYKDWDNIPSLYRITEYKNGLKNGKEIIFHQFPNDTCNVIEYKAGKKNGKYLDFLYNNVLIFEGHYINDRRNGLFKYFDLNHEIVYTETYKNDTLVESNTLSGNFSKEEYYNRIKSLTEFVSLVKFNYHNDSIYYKYFTDRYKSEVKFDTNYFYVLSRIHEKIKGKSFVIKNYWEAKKGNKLYPIESPYAEKVTRFGYLSRDMFVVITKDMKNNDDYIYLLMEGDKIRSPCPTKQLNINGVLVIWMWSPY